MIDTNNINWFIIQNTFDVFDIIEKIDEIKNSSLRSENIDIEIFDKILKQKKNEFEHNFKKFYYINDMYSVNTYFAADYYSGGIERIFKNSLLPEDTDLIIDKNYNKIISSINEKQIKYNNIPESFVFFKIFLYEETNIDIDKEDLTFFIGEDYFGQDYCEDDEVGLCVWLSKKLGKIDLIFHENNFIFINCWDSGELDEGFSNYIDIDYDNQCINGVDNSISDIDEDICFKYNLNSDLKKIFNIP